jgi:hypothetical protein
LSVGVEYREERQYFEENIGKVRDFWKSLFGKVLTASQWLVVFVGSEGFKIERGAIPVGAAPLFVCFM